MKIKILSLLLISVSFKANAQTPQSMLPDGYEVILSCGPSEGIAYYPSRGLAAFSEEDAGWQEDKISTGKIFFVRDSEGGYDIYFVDASNTLKSATGQGAFIVPLLELEEKIVLSVFYDIGVYEHYYLHNDGELIYTQMKAEAIIEKAAILVSQCK